MNKTSETGFRLPARKMRVELFDSEGNRYSIAFEGLITRDKAVRLLDLVELLGGMSGNEARGAVTGQSLGGEAYSKLEKVRMVILKNFPLVWFSSREVQTAYEQQFKEPISLSTAATYLSRLASKGALMKVGPSNSLKYRIAPGIPQVLPDQKIP